ncbi:MAG: ABC-F family ATP-binding cassette domain-containing protein, partial [Phycisphaerales bacterium]|nr:ABC-F family ATP-binding cassette domain-containing protein [Phycisphaerales bacterium]
EAYIRKYKAGQRAKQARGREARLEREKQSSTIERPVELAELRLQLPKAPRAGDLVVSARGLTKVYPLEGDREKVLFRDLDLTIQRGERWGVIGPNGAGKTTVVSCLLGDTVPTAGTSKLGANVAPGHFTQTHEHMPGDETVHRFIQNEVRRACEQTISEQQARNLGGAFLFSGDEQEKEIAVLSGGEKARCRLAALLASARNLLVLDEPTNHLDIPSAERLEEALSTEGGYDGTLILVSHDRALIDATCDHLLVLDGQGGAKVFLGNYSEWQDALAGRTASPASNAPAAPTPRRSESPAPAAKSPPKAQPNAAPQAADEPRRKNPFSWMSLDKIEARIGEIEARVAAIDTTLDDPDIWAEVDRANALTEERDALRDELGTLEEEWIRKSG